MVSEQTWETVESGPYDYHEGLHPVMVKNYGKWQYHEEPKPGVLKHVAENGDMLWTVRAGTPRQDSVDFVRRLCDVADKYTDGFLRFTVRSNVEYMTPDEDTVQLLIDELEGMGLPVGGTGPTVSQMAHTQGWLHCDIPSSDAAGVVKALMDELIDEFKGMNMPNKVKLVTQCCELNCGGQGDIMIIVKHTRPPRINHEILSEICELPKAVARCPVAAIRPTVVNGRKSLMVDDEKCMYCGACFGACPAMEINHPEFSKFAVWVGGKNSNARSRPAQGCLVAHELPNNPPRWPEVSDVVKRIVYAYKDGGNPWERMNEWIDRIGWRRFFEETGLKFDEDMIDNYRHARTTFNQSAHVRF